MNSDPDIIQRNYELEKELTSLHLKLQRSQEELFTLRIMNKKCFDQKDQEESFLEHRVEEQLSHFRARAEMCQAEADRLREECTQLSKDRDCIESSRVKLKSELEESRLQIERLSYTNQLIETKMTSELAAMQHELKQARESVIEEQRCNHQLQKQHIRIRYQYEQAAKANQHLSVSLQQLQQQSLKTQDLCEQYEKARHKLEFEHSHELKQITKQCASLKQKNQALTVQLNHCSGVVEQLQRHFTRAEVEKGDLGQQLQGCKMRLCEYEAEQRLKARHEERLKRKREKLARLNIF